ncbi:MAG: sigma-70 family RNA polymerase sigma factor [Planctomycetota bacterium]
MLSLAESSTEDTPDTNTPIAAEEYRRKAAATTLTPTHDPESMVDSAPSSKRAKRALRPDEREILDRLLNEKYEYVDHELFELSDIKAYRAVFLEAEPVPVPDVSWYHGLLDPSSSVDTSSLDKAAKKGGSVVLTAAQERVLFAQYNYCRMRVCRLRDRLLGVRADGTKSRAKPLTDYGRRKAQREMLDWYVRADALRTQIADTNLALVLAMAKRTRMHPGDFPDLISEGNMALLRAADKFDVSRGFKFSTYACRAILKAFSRQGIKLTKYRGMFPVEFDPTYERSNYQSEKNAAHEDDCADEVRRIVVDNRARLSDVERTVVAARFNVQPETPARKPTPKQKPAAAKASAARFSLSMSAGDQYELPAALRRRSPDDKPMTLEQVGKLIGVTKERVRQIQNKALDKIRDTLEVEYLR